MMLLALRKKACFWLLATRPKTLTAAATPLLATAALIHKISGSFSLSVTFFSLMAALFIQIGTNLINDACDFKMGADTAARLGPKRATLEGWLSFREVFSAGTLSFVVAACFAAPLIAEGGLFFAFLLTASIASGYMYTCGRRSLAYVGLGELFVFLFFGEVACNALFWLHLKKLAIEPFLLGAEMGFLAVTMIAINNLRDIKEDRKAGKKTLACRLGKLFARVEITFSAIAPFLLNMFWFPLGYLKCALFPLFSLPLALFVVKQVWQREPSCYYNKILAASAFLHQLFGGLIIAGLLL